MLHSSHTVAPLDTHLHFVGQHALWTDGFLFTPHPAWFRGITQDLSSPLLLGCAVTLCAGLVVALRCRRYALLDTFGGRVAFWRGNSACRLLNSVTARSEAAYGERLRRAVIDYSSAYYIAYQPSTGAISNQPIAIA